MKIRFEAWPDSQSGYLIPVGGSGTAINPYPISNLAGYLHEIEVSGLSGKWYLSVDGSGGNESSYQNIDFDAYTSNINSPTIDYDILKAVNNIQGSGNEYSGSGAIQKIVTITSRGVIVEGAEVWVTTDEAGLDIVAGTLYTNQEGKVYFMLDEGTYYVWAHKVRYNFSNPTRIEVEE